MELLSHINIWFWQIRFQNGLPNMADIPNCQQKLLLRLWQDAESPWKWKVAAHSEIMFPTIPWIVWEAGSSC